MSHVPRSKRNALAATTVNSAKRVSLPSLLSPPTANPRLVEIKGLVSRNSPSLANLENNIRTKSKEIYKRTTRRNQFDWTNFFLCSLLDLNTITSPPSSPPQRSLSTIEARVPSRDLCDARVARVNVANYAATMKYRGVKTKGRPPTVGPMKNSA